VSPGWVLKTVLIIAHAILPTVMVEAGATGQVAQDAATLM